MKFITIEDLTTLVDEMTVDIMTQLDESNLDRAEEFAIEEVSGYLRSRYDILKAFDSDRDERNKQLIMIVCDIMIYHLNSHIPGKMNSDLRKQRYDDAIKWCRSVQSGQCSPNLPLYIDETNTDLGSAFRTGSMKANKYDY